MNFLENITFRRARTQSDSKDISCTVSTLDDTVSSLPDLSTEDGYDTLLSKYKEQIDALTSRLNSAQTEIESLTLENNKLKELNNELIKKNDYDKMRTDNSIKIRKLNMQNKQTTFTNPSNKKIQTDEATATCSIKNGSKNNGRIDSHKDNLDSDKSIDNCEHIKRPKKISILSTNRNNKILNIAERTLQGFRLCHYLYPDCDIRHLLKDIERKLEGHSIDDYCVIMIGEADFKKTKNYFDLIYYIRDTLQMIKHTNVIICLPTYKYGYLHNMFNWRVETFNNLLYLDITTHQHAYLLDSNKKITYDFHMFHKHFGFLNNNGMYTIINNIKELISEIQDYYYYSSEELTNNDQESPKEIESLFFRE